MVCGGLRMSDCCRTWRACGLAWWVVRERTARIEGMWVVAGAARQLGICCSQCSIW